MALMRRPLTLTLILLACALAVAPAAYASWHYATQTTTGARTASRSETRGCSVQTRYSALRMSCSGLGVAKATYVFQLPSNVRGKPALSLVPALGPYIASVKVVGSTATATVRVTAGTYTLKLAHLVYYVVGRALPASGESYASFTRSSSAALETAGGMPGDPDLEEARDESHGPGLVPAQCSRVRRQFPRTPTPSKAPHPPSDSNRRLCRRSAERA